MDGLVLQDWTTTRGQGGAGITTVIQSESAWLDLAAYRDIVAWLDVREASADAGVTVQLTFQTAPAKDESLFVAMASPVNLSAGLIVVPMLAPLAAAPLSRYLRWRLSPSATTATPWDVTFRCIVAANRPGRRRRPTTSTASQPVLQEMTTGPGRRTP